MTEDGEPVDLDALQAQIDLSMAMTEELVATWIHPSYKSSPATKAPARDLEEYLRRPPRLGVGAPIPTSSSGATARETALLKGKLQGKRLREEETSKSKLLSDEHDDEMLVKGADMKITRLDPFAPKMKKVKAGNEEPREQPTTSIIARAEGPKSLPVTTPAADVDGAAVNGTSQTHSQIASSPNHPLPQNESQLKVEVEDVPKKKKKKKKRQKGTSGVLDDPADGSDDIDGPSQVSLSLVSQKLSNSEIQMDVDIQENAQTQEEEEREEVWAGFEVSGDLFDSHSKAEADDPPTTLAGNTVSSPVTTPAKARDLSSNPAGSPLSVVRDSPSGSFLQSPISKKKRRRKKKKDAE